MGKSTNHKITPLPEAEKTLTDTCESSKTCRNFPQFRVEYDFAPARHNADQSQVVQGKTEHRRFLYCLPHAQLLCRKEGICLDCGTRYAKSADAWSCGPCDQKREKITKVDLSAPPILPPPFGPAPNVRA